MRGLLVTALAFLVPSEIFLHFIEKGLAAEVVQNHEVFTTAVAAGDIPTTAQWTQFEGTLIGLGMVHASIWLIPCVIIFTGLLLFMHTKKKRS